MKPTLAFGIVGTGGIAAALAGSRRVRVVNVLGSSADKGRAFAKRWRLPRSAGTLAELLADPEVEAVYVATPHPLHEAHVLAAIDARKPVLCEKPLAVSVEQAER